MPPPHSDPTGTTCAFEKEVKKDAGGGGWADVNATFSDGTSLAGELQINQNGYANSSDWFFNTAAGTSLNGTPIGAFSFQSMNGSTASIAAPPNTYAIDFFNGSYSEELDLTFAHPLNIGGPDAIVPGVAAYYPSMPNSGQYAGFTCSASYERLITSAFAQVPEPTSTAIITAGLFGFGVLERKRRTERVDAV